jgi:hypothetical protein
MDSPLPLTRTYPCATEDPRPHLSEREAAELATLLRAVELLPLLVASECHHAASVQVVPGCCNINPHDPSHQRVHQQSPLTSASHTWITIASEYVRLCVAGAYD